MAKTSVRVPMSVKMRAKQFMMFDAMKGLTEAIAEKERQLFPKKELAEDQIAEINECLKALHPGDNVVVDYYCQYENIYKQMTGQIKKIDMYWETIQIGDCSISFSEISNIVAPKYDSA